MNSRHLHPCHLRNLRRQQVLPASNHTRHLLIHVKQASKSSHLPHLLRKPQYPKPAKRTQLHQEPHQPHIAGRNVIVLRVSQSLRRPRGAILTRTFRLLYGKCLARIVNNTPHEMFSAMMKTWKLMRLFLRERRLTGQTSTLFIWNLTLTLFFFSQVPELRRRRTCWLFKKKNATRKKNENAREKESAQLLVDNIVCFCLPHPPDAHAFGYLVILTDSTCLF